MDHSQCSFRNSGGNRGKGGGKTFFEMETISELMEKSHCVRRGKGAKYKCMSSGHRFMHYFDNILVGTQEKKENILEQAV